MIVFDLACECGFLFEGWFKDHEEFTRQEREGLLRIPYLKIPHFFGSKL
jgi:hypothetical protein